jgi:2-iminobutanoate/2-iminopropanoate deaminase
MEYRSNGREMKKIILVFVLFLLSLVETTYGQELKKEYVDPVPQESRSTGVKVKGGTMLFLAGHTASLSQRDADHGNIDAQVKRTFDKIKNTLSQAGGSLDDIVTMSVFLTDLRYIPDFNKVTKELFKKGFPAVTFVEVSHLARPQLLIEIQPIAVIP